MTDAGESDAEPGGATDTMGSGSGDVEAGPSGSERNGVPDAMLADAGAGTDEGTDDPPWYRSTLGLGLVGANLALLLLLVVLSASVESDGPLGNVASGAGSMGLGVATSPLSVPVPWYVYIFGAVGALAYVFTLLVVEFERSASSLARMCLRIPAALPLCAGVYLLSTQILGSDPPTQLIAGLAFLAGLYVDLTYRRLDALARRLLPSSGDDSGNGTDDTHNEEPDPENEPGSAEGEQGHTEIEAGAPESEGTAAEDESTQDNSDGSGTPG